MKKPEKKDPHLEVTELVLRARCDHCGKIVERGTKGGAAWLPSMPALPLWSLALKEPGNADSSIAFLACWTCMKKSLPPRVLSAIRAPEEEPK